MIAGDSTSRIVSGQVDITAEPWPIVRGRYPAIYNHSAASDAREAVGWSLPSTRLITQRIVDGLKHNIVGTSMVLSWGVAGLTAASPYGTATFRGRVEDSVTYHIAQYGSSGKVGLYGTSMGSLSSLLYALEHPTNVRWMVLLSPVPLLKEYEAANTSGNRASIDTAWNVTAGNLPSVADVYTRVMNGELGTIPVLWVNSSDDVYSTGTFLTKFNQVVAITGGFQQALGAVGHGEGTAAAADLNGIQAFIQAHQ